MMVIYHERMRKLHTLRGKAMPLDWQVFMAFDGRAAMGQTRRPMLRQLRGIGDMNGKDIISCRNVGKGHEEDCREKGMGQMVQRDRHPMRNRRRLLLRKDNRILLPIWNEGKDCILYEVPSQKQALPLMERHERSPSLWGLRLLKTEPQNETFKY